MTLVDVQAIRAKLAAGLAAGGVVEVRKSDGSMTKFNTADDIIAADRYYASLEASLTPAGTTRRPRILLNSRSGL